jgi:hypothetical protein
MPVKFRLAQVRAAQTIIYLPRKRLPRKGSSMLPPITRILTKAEIKELDKVSPPLALDQSLNSHRIEIEDCCRNPIWLPKAISSLKGEKTSIQVISAVKLALPPGWKINSWEPPGLNHGWDFFSAEIFIEKVLTHPLHGQIHIHTSIKIESEYQNPECKSFNGDYSQIFGLNFILPSSFEGRRDLVFHFHKIDPALSKVKCNR